jgi:hypothetical protein
MAGSTKRARVALWILQGALAALFLFAGGMKLALPMAELAKVAPLPAFFLKLIGVLEVAGALGLVLPGALHIRQGLTSLAAAGLTLVMVGAVIVTVATQCVAMAAIPFGVGVLTATVALGRRRRPEVGSEWRAAPGDH